MEEFFTKRLYILGEAREGPTNEPVYIDSINKCMGIFGDCKLTRTWFEAYQSQRNNIDYYCVRINGEPSYLTLKGETEKNIIYNNALCLSTYCSGQKWNNTRVQITAEAITICNPHLAGGGYVEFPFAKFPILGLLEGAINTCFEKQMICTKAYTKQFFKSSYDLVRYYKPILGTNIYLQGGEDEINNSKNSLYALYNKSYNIIEGQYIDVLLMSDVYFDDFIPEFNEEEKEYGKLFYNAGRDYLTNGNSFHSLLISFCKRQLRNGIITHGVLPLNPVENIEDYISSKAYSSKVIIATAMKDRIGITEGDNDDGKFISITAGDFEYIDPYGNKYYSNSAPAYSALICSQTNSNSTTNKLIPYIENMRYYFEDEELTTLSKLGITTFRKSMYKGGIVVTNGVTASLYNSPYHTLANMRMCQLIMTTFRMRYDEYIGENLTILTRDNVLQKVADELVKVLLELKLAKDIKARVAVNDFGYMRVYLDIKPFYSIEYISAQTTIKL